MINHPLNIRFDYLSQLPQRMHLYCTDTNHKVMALNALQAQINAKLCGIKNTNEIKGLSILDIYQKDKARGQRLCNENEQVLAAKKTFTFKSTLIIPGEILIELMTTKLPCHDQAGRIIGVIGLSFYVREMQLNLAKDFKLSKRELDCLDCLLLNKTAKETSLILGLSQRTVEDYLENAKHKLNCQSKAELAMKLKKMNLINRYMK